MKANLLVFYGSAGYFSARSEVHKILSDLGDQKSIQELMAPGCMGVTTKIKNREVVEEVKEKYSQDPTTITATTQWVPVDNWCHPQMQEIREILREDINPIINADNLIGIEYIEHNTDFGFKKEIDTMIGGLRDNERPEKLVRIDLFSEYVGITLMKPERLFRK